MIEATWTDWAIFLIGGGLLGGLAKAILNWKIVKDFMTEIEARRRKKFAEKQVAHCQNICSAPAYMSAISTTLKQIQEQLDINQHLLMKIQGKNIKRTSDEFCKKGWMPQDDKDELLDDYMPYWMANGNGKVEYKFILAMNLPLEKGGMPFNIDLITLLSEERRRKEK